MLWSLGGAQLRRAIRTPAAGRTTAMALGCTILASVSMLFLYPVSRPLTRSPLRTASRFDARSAPIGASYGRSGLNSPVEVDSGLPDLPSPRGARHRKCRMCHSGVILGKYRAVVN
jgi:hypothetical protein